jgi:hypothetical protein
MTNLVFRINNTVNDVAYGSMESGDDYYIDVASDDILLFTNGSDIVKDGELLPSEEDINRAATLLSLVSPVTVAKYILEDISEARLREAKLAGLNKRYAFCVSFDGPTATEPQLEAWDNASLNSILSVCLGAGTANSSWYKAICTTDALPGVRTYVNLAGAGTSNVVKLNAGNGALSGAKDLYFNFKVIIPATPIDPAQYLPVLLITYTTN